MYACYHQLHVSDPLQLLKYATDFYEILKHREHYSAAGHRTLVPPNFHCGRANLQIGATLMYHST